MSTPNPIPHLIDAVAALALALRDLAAPRSIAVNQDGIEHLTEAELLLELIKRRLDGADS
jgi:hypothetical protein